MSKLCVNIDHVATVRESRGEEEPPPLLAMYLAELAGCDGITIHLREDERHINKKDVYEIVGKCTTKLNLEISLHPDVEAVALDAVPYSVCIVPERRQEITTEGGIDVFRHEKELAASIARYQEKGIVVSLFIEGTEDNIRQSKALGVDRVELHTGRYARARGQEKSEMASHLLRMVDFGVEQSMVMNLGHGLNYHNIQPFCNNPEINEFNIGHSIIGRSIFVGLERAVKEMKDLISGNA